MTRTFLRRLARALVGVLLFAQVTVAAYACPKLLPQVGAPTASLEATPQTGGGESAREDAKPTGCAEMGMTTEPDTPPDTLCAEHCRFGQQSDHTASVTVPLPPLTALYSMPRSPEFVSPNRQTAASPSALIAASPPPTIRHCRLLV